MHRLLQWFRLEGSTPRERIRQNPKQLVALVVVLWVGTLTAYVTFSSFMGSRWATFVILLGAVAVGLHLRQLLIPPSDPTPDGADDA